MSTWFAANLLFHAVHSGDDAPPDLWEERIILIQASAESDALSKANALGQEPEAPFLAISGHEVTWRFDRVERIHSIDSEDLQSGTEVFSRHLRSAEVESLLKPFDD